ncbi:MAG TPA: threonine--tRNA ligase [Chloroflexota bacterium]|jgi:threonyl-tRNA synthetase
MAMSDLERMRHSAAHVMAKAVTDLVPGTKVAIGPPIEDGFYYDFDLPRELTPDDFPAIEERMRAQIAAHLPFERDEWPVARAREHFDRLGEKYKVELIDDLVKNEAVEKVGIYKHGDFLDLCRGPHVHDSGDIGAVKLLRLAGAYWRGDAKREQLTRVYATAWPTQAELDDYLHRLEEARKRDHRLLGKQLELYSFHEESPGSPFWLPNGTILRQEIEDFVRAEHRKRGYKEVRTPVILDRSLWERSGHWKLYKGNMFVTETEDREYGVKPMNCIGAYTIYRERLHSFRELPLRLAELTGILHRNELSGTLAGLFRVRQFVQDDSHIFVAPEELEAELERVLDFGIHMLRAFGFEEFVVALSVRDPENKDKFLGADELWESAEGSLKRVAAARGIEPEIMFGEAKFYGPSLDIHVRDALGRLWQCTTVQVDFNAPERFDLEYVGSDGAMHRPVVVHRALIGSFERFIGVLTEHYAGAFPLWLAPVQAIVVPIADRHQPYAEQVAAQLGEAGLRVEIDERREKMQAKIRDAQLRKIPYMLVVGDREAAEGTAAVRLRTNENLGPMPVAELAAMAGRLIESRSQELTDRPVAAAT